MPSIITVRLGWTPSLPDGVQVEGLPANVTLESVMSNIQGYRVRDISLHRLTLLSIKYHRISCILTVSGSFSEPLTTLENMHHFRLYDTCRIQSTGNPRARRGRTPKVISKYITKSDYRQSICFSILLPRMVRHHRVRLSRPLEHG